MSGSAQALSDPAGNLPDTLRQLFTGLSRVGSLAKLSRGLPEAAESPDHAEFALVSTHEVGRPPDQIMYRLAADPLLFRDLIERQIVINSMLVYLLLMGCKELPVEIVQESLFYYFFHTCAILLSVYMIVKQIFLTNFIFFSFSFEAFSFEAFCGYSFEVFLLKPFLLRLFF